MQTALIAIVLALTSTDAFGQITTQNYVEGPVVVAADGEFSYFQGQSIIMPYLASITAGDIYFVAGNVSVNTNNASASSWNIWYSKLDSECVTITTNDTASFVAPEKIFYYNNYAVGFGTDSDDIIPQIRAYQIPLAGEVAIPRLTISTNTNATYTPTIAQTTMIGGVVYIFYNAANLKVNVTNFAVGSSTVGTPEFTLSTTFDNPLSLSVAWNEALGSNQLFAIWIQNDVLLDSVLDVSQGIVVGPTAVNYYNSSCSCSAYNTDVIWYGVLCTTLTSGIVSIYITKGTGNLVPLSNSNLKFIFTAPYGPYLAIFYQNATNGDLCYEIWNLDTITLIKAITVFVTIDGIGNMAQLAVPSKGFYTLIYNVEGAPSYLTTSVQVGLLLAVTTTTCPPCAIGCANCSGSNNTECSSCSSGYYLQPSSNTCLSSCPSEYYTNSTNNTCLSCSTGCVSCESAATCDVCAQEYYFLPGKTACVTTCTSGLCSYAQNTSCIALNTCLACTASAAQCDDTCATCNQAGPSQCISCDYPRELINNSCPITYMSLASAATLGNFVNVVMQTSIVASSILPAVTGGVSTSAMLLIGFLAEVDLYKYINVPFPENFVVFCQQIGVSALPNIFAGMDTVNGGNNPNSTIGKFKFWGISATLLDNSYTSIFKELVTLGIILLLNILVLIFKRNQKLRSNFFKIRTLFMWNVFLSYFLGDFSELQLNSMIQMRENYVSSAYADFSLALAIIIVVTYSGLFPYMVYILNRRKLHQEEIRNDDIVNNRENNTRVPPENTQIESFIEVPDSIKIIAEDFHERNRFTRNFMLIMLLQFMLLIFLDFFLQDYGLAQAVIYTILTLVYVSLIAWQRPFKSKVQIGILLLNQTTKVLMGIMAILLGANDKSQFISSLLIILIGYFLIALIMIVVVINLLILIAMIIVAIYKMIKVLKSACKKTALSPRNNDGNLEIRREDDSTLEQSRIQVANDSIDNLADNSKSSKSQHIEKEKLKEEMTIQRYPKKSTLDSSQSGMDSNHPRNQSLFEKNSDSSRDVQVESRRMHVPSHNSSNNHRTHNVNSLDQFNPKTRSTVEKRNPIELEDGSKFAPETETENSFAMNYNRPLSLILKKQERFMKD